MPCGCCGEGFCFGHLMYMFEKIAAFCAMAAIISCIVVTVLISIGVGVGVGYNYCFVDQKTYRISAIENLRNSKNPPKLPESPNLFPFKASGVDSTNNVSANTSASDATAADSTNAGNTDKGTPQGSSNDELTDASRKTTTASGFNDISPDLSGANAPFEPIFPKIPNIPNIPGPKTVSSGSYELKKSLGVQGSISPNSDDTLNVKGLPGSQKPVFNDTGFALGIPQSPNFLRNPMDSGSFFDVPSYRAGQEPPTNYSERQGIPQSPNFPETFRRVPIITSKLTKQDPSVLSGDVPAFKRPKPGPETVWRRKQFEEIREGIKANAKDIDTKSGSIYIDDADDSEESNSDETTEYKRRKTVGRKHKKTFTPSAKMSATVMPTIVIPFKKYANMSPLISKILAQNKNVTLQFITL